MNIKQDILTWLCECLNLFKFKQVKYLPRLGVVQEWGGDDSKGFFQLFVNHDGFLYLYLNNNTNAAAYKCEIPYAAEHYVEASTLTEEEVSEIMKESKKESLNDERHLKEKKGLENSIARMKIANKISWENLLSIFADKNSLVHEGEAFSVGNVGVLEGDFLLLNADRTGMLVSDKSGWSKIAGTSSSNFGLFKGGEEKWVFFTNNGYLLPQLREITASTVVFYKDGEMLSEISRNKQANQRFVVFADMGQKALDENTFFYAYPQELETWGECLGGAESHKDIQEYLRGIISRK